MSVPDPTEPVPIRLSRAEQWVAHHVMLDALDLAGSAAGGDTLSGEKPAGPLAILEKLEVGSHAFTPEELDCLREHCAAHARTTEATADRNLADAIATRVDSVLEPV